MSAINSSSPVPPAATARRGFPWPSPQKLPLLVTLAVFVLMYVAACLKYDNFFAPQVAINLVGDNAVLGVAAIGMTFVILSGGIDLSVGTAVGCGSVFIASMVESHGWHPLLAVFVTLLGGLLVGTVQGLLIARFDLQPFLVTLGGLFLYKGVGLLISQESISLTHPLYVWMSERQWHLGEEAAVPLWAMIFLGLLAIAAFVAACRPAGRAVYAVGGSEQSALLMGLPVASVKVGVYAVSGLCAALAAVVSTIFTSSGAALTGGGLELDAIAAVVIGGTLLTGGVGGPVGTLFGVLIFGIIQTAITFQGNLSSWWARIVLGLLLLAFILLQTLLQPKEDHA